MIMIPNLDVLSVGVVVAATCVFGFTVYFSNRKSITNKIFLFFSLITALWVIANYFSYHTYNIVQALWAIRIVVFLATFQAIALYELFLVFPHETFTFSKYNKFFLVPTAFIIAALMLTPLGFKSANIVSNAIVPTANEGIGILLFAFFTIALVFKTFSVLILKIKKTQNSIEKKPLRIILIGSIISYSLIVIFNLIFPSLFNITNFIPYSSLFVFPSVIFTSYAILKHKLLQIKASEAVILIFILLSATLAQVVYSHTFYEIILRGAMFLLIVVFCIFLLRLVINESDQKYKIQQLANDLEIANLRLTELSELKIKFTSLATHQLATPLTAIKGYISLLQEENYSNKTLEEQQMLSGIQRLTNNLVTVIGDFLDISQLEDNVETPIITTFDLNSLLTNLSDRFRTLFERKGILFSIGIEQTNSLITTDNIKLQQAINNILENSVKYTKSGFVHIQLVNRESKYQITITDSGVRNFPDIPDKLIKKFTHSGNKNEANIIGNSLGLFVAKQIIELLSGNFSIKQSFKPDGVIFNVELYSKSDIV
jgi:signal transduction histidine kinase